MIKRILAPLLVGLVLALVACGGDGSTPTSVVDTPTATPTIARTPPATPTEEEGLHAPRPEINPQLDELGEGVLELVVASGDTASVDALELAVDAGVDPTDCVFFFFVFAWQVLQPDPTADIDLEFYDHLERGERVLLGGGPSGERALGCSSLEVVNNSAAEVTLELRYVLAIFRD